MYLFIAKNYYFKESYFSETSNNLEDLFVSNTRHDMLLVAKLFNDILYRVAVKEPMSRPVDYWIENKDLNALWTISTKLRVEVMPGVDTFVFFVFATKFMEMTKERPILLPSSVHVLLIANILWHQEYCELALDELFEFVCRHIDTVVDLNVCVSCLLLFISMSSFIEEEKLLMTVPLLLKNVVFQKKTVVTVETLYALAEIAAFTGNSFKPFVEDVLKKLEEIDELKGNNQFITHAEGEVYVSLLEFIDTGFLRSMFTPSRIEHLKKVANQLENGDSEIQKDTAGEIKKFITTKLIF